MRLRHNPRETVMLNSVTLNYELGKRHLCDTFICDDRWLMDWRLYKCGG